MMMTGMCGKRALILESSDSPDSPGIRISDTSTRGGGPAPSRAASTSAAEPKLLYGISSRARAFSSTQRIERSSSTIQTAFMSVTHTKIEGEGAAW
jgi:hypothetical protein